METTEIGASKTRKNLGSYNYLFTAPVIALAGRGPAANSPITVVKRIYYPQTGLGYLLLDYNTYGMARRISVRKGMTQAGGAFGDGAEIAYTKYNYTTIDALDPYNRNQVGALNDSPQYTQRSEWWQEKTDDLGNPDSTPTVMSFSRSSGTDASGNITEIDKATYVNATGTGLQVWTTTANDPIVPELQGKVLTTEYRTSTGAVLRKVNQTYVSGSDGGVQIGEVETFDEANQPNKVAYSYGTYGRLKSIYEYGYKVNGNYFVRRSLALTTRARISSDDSAGVSPDSSLNFTAGTSMWMSMRSKSGPDIFETYLCICIGEHLHSRVGSLKWPQGQGCVALLPPDLTHRKVI